MPLLAKQSRSASHHETLELPLGYTPSPSVSPTPKLADALRSFRDFGQPTRELQTPYQAPDGQPRQAATYVNEFWTAKQRQASSLHEISYRVDASPPATTPTRSASF